MQQLRNQGKGGQTKTSRFRGVMKHAKGKWEARLGQLSGGKYQYLGLFGTEIDAAVAYDRALVAQKGLEADTNFALENYEDMLGALLWSTLQAAHAHRCAGQALPAHQASQMQRHVAVVAIKECI